MPVIPATQEVEAGESLEAGKQRLPSAEITPLNSSLGTLSQEKKLIDDRIIVLMLRNTALPTC